jgi:hypothetical protein
MWRRPAVSPAAVIATVERRPTGVTRGTGPMVVISRDGREVARFPLIGNPPPTMAAIDELARLHLLAARRGYDVRIHDPCTRLAWLVRLAGLEAVLLAELTGDGSVVEVLGEAEQGEEIGVEEAVVSDDPSF